MSYFAQSESTESTLLVAFANLLKKFEVDQANPSLIKRVLNDQDITEFDWGSIVDFTERLMVDRFGEENTWPETNNAIVKYAIEDRISDTEVVTRELYCLVADARNHMIVDSHDGQIKSTNTYGRPVSWASYLLRPEADEETWDEPLAVPAKDDSLYQLKKGESIWSVARKLKVDAIELAEHNGIEKNEMINITEDHILHLPKSTALPKEPTVGYEIYPEERLMYISIKDGTRKYSFGNVQRITDISPTGPVYKEGHPVKVVAVAHVPVVDNDEKKVLAFYMDTQALGSYKETGRVAQTIGYNWTHLEDGVFTPETSESPVSPVQDPPKTDPEPQPEPQIKADIVVKEKLTWKQQIARTYQQFSDGPVWFIAKTDMIVRDFETVRAPKKIQYRSEILIAGTFKVDGITYGLPQQGAESGIAWGIPMHKLVEKIIETEDDKQLYTVTGKPLKLNFKFSKDGRLTTEEQLVTAPLAKASGKYLDVVKIAREKIKTIRR